MSEKRNQILLPVVILSLLVIALLFWLFRSPTVPEYEVSTSPEVISEGEYLVFAGGCISCHLNPDDGETLSGGLALESDFGTFFVPNITPDPDTGIGNWSGGDFIRALKHGRSPGGEFYYPAFPYLSYGGMTDEDALAIAAYLQSLEPVDHDTQEHDLSGWLSRWMMAGWNRLASSSIQYPDQYDDPGIQRGAYLARNLGHCGECHTPRNSLGIPDLDREFAGAVMGESEAEPLDHEELAEWSEEDFAFFLFLGLKPDDEFVGGEMEAVIEHNTSKLTDEDRAALAAFFIRGQTGQD